MCRARGRQNPPWQGGWQRATAIVSLPEPGERREATVGPVGNLLLAEELEVSMIVQGDDRRQSPTVDRRPEDETLRAWTETDGP
jgi:hypothetical protein